MKREEVFLRYCIFHQFLIESHHEKHTPTTVSVLAVCKQQSTFLVFYLESILFNSCNCYVLIFSRL